MNWQGRHPKSRVTARASAAEDVDFIGNAFLSINSPCFGPICDWTRGCFLPCKTSSGRVSQ